MKAYGKFEPVIGNAIVKNRVFKSSRNNLLYQKIDVAYQALFEDLIED